MAGAGRRTFQPGEVLTASNVMSYLQDQAVMVFDDAAARGSAIGTAVVSEGMVSYLKDVNTIEVYDSANWKKVFPSVANTGEIVQVLSATATASVSTTSATYQDVTGVSVTITPKSATNKILVFANGQASNSSDAHAVALTILRDSTQIYVGTGGTLNLSSIIYTASLFIAGTFALNHLDSPATTSATTYKLQFRAQSTGTAYVGRRGQDTAFAVPTTITVMEVVA